MFGLAVALGSAAHVLTEEKFKTCWPTSAKCRTLAPTPGVFLARFTPSTCEQDSGFVSSEDGQVVVCVDGYLITSEAAGRGLAENLRSFVDICRRDGFEAAMKSVIAGAYTLVVVDLLSGMTHVANDHVGSLPMYYGSTQGGLITSTNPVALAATGLIDATTDMAACAEWAYYGSNIGDRYMVKGARLLYPYHSLQWDAAKEESRLFKSPDSPWDIMPSEKYSGVDELADAFVAGCLRLSAVDPEPAHFQSAGKDSRLILAAWPDGYDPKCYTYGDPESLEVWIAKSVADLRGSQWNHVWLDGDEVAGHLGDMFNACGMIIWPDRWFTARQMQQDGHVGTTDGYWGGVQIHPGGYDCDRYFSTLTRLGRLFTVYVDQKISDVGMDRITEAMLHYLTHGHDCRPYMRYYVTDDFIAELDRHIPEVKQDIHDELERLRPANDSLAILWRNFIASNRGAHQHAQQGVQCRSFVNVYYPHCADLEFHRKTLSVPPRVAAHDRQYIELYRKRFPSYGDLLYGTTLLPLRTGAFRTKLSNMLMSRGYEIPYITGKTYGRDRDANSWGAWLRQSDALRRQAAELLRQGGIIDETRVAETFAAFADGSRSGTGQLFHLASMGRWLTISKSGSENRSMF